MSWWEKYQVHVPEGSAGPWKIEKFEVDPNDTYARLENLRMQRDGLRGRSIYAGRYTRLMRGYSVVMSDTPAEISDHLPILDRLEGPAVRRVLINGLGLGLVLAHAIRQPHIERIDVVEIDKYVIELVGSYYENYDLTQPFALKKPPKLRVAIHNEDAMLKAWPKNTRWDLAWHDIWDDISTDNLEGIGVLNRRYGRRVDWQGAWCHGLLLDVRRRYG